MNKPIVLFAFAASLSVFVAALECDADTIYSNLGPGLSYLSGAFWTVGLVPQLDQTHSVAQPFTVPLGSSFTLTEIDIALVWNSGPNAFVVTLLKDAAGMPGSLLSSWSVTNVPPILSTNTIQPSQTISVITGITLTSGTQYWLGAFPANPPPFLSGWSFACNNNLLCGGTVAVSLDNGDTWSLSKGTAAGFRVAGNTVVPEPATLTLLGLGIAVILTLHRKNSRRTAAR